MPVRTTLTTRLDLTHPIVQAPMAGGGDTAELVAAVCNAGGLGFVGAAYLTPAQIVERAREVRARTSRPFGINLFAPMAAPTVPADAAATVAKLASFFTELDLPAPTVPPVVADPFEAQVEAVLQTSAAVFSVAFGPIPPALLSSLKQRMFVMGTATSVAEAIALADTGVDAIIAQGSEAGGHRGSFATEFSRAMVGTLALVPQIVDAVALPVLAAGGIMDGRGIAAALALGAAGVQMGTAFLTCPEAGVVEAYKARLLQASDTDTQITRAFSGRPARGIVNRFMTETEASGAILPFPLQNAVTRPLRTAAAKRGDAEYLSLWAGQAARLGRRLGAAALIEILATETDSAIARLSPAAPPPL